MKRSMKRALTLLVSFTLTVFGACSGDRDAAGTSPVGTQVRIALTPVFDGPDQVPPALDPIELRARVTDLTETTEFYDESFPVEAGTIFEDELDFEVAGGTTQAVLFLQLEAQNGTVVWSAGPDTIVIPEEGEIGTVTPVFQWVGPGAGATRLELTPAEVAIDAGDDTTLVVTAFDQDGNPITGTASAVDWVSESTGLGDFVGQSGLWQSNGTRGEVRVIATLSPQQLSDTSLIVVQPAPSDLLILGGFRQRAPAGSTLESPVEVQVIATDEEPLAGRTVLFLPQNGGSVGRSSVVTDEEGLARTSWTLGAEVGVQTLRLEVQGRPEIFAELEADATPVEFRAPTSVTSTAESGGAPPGGIAVAWLSDDPNVERFQVERSVDGGFSWSSVADNVAGEDRSVVDPGPDESWPRDQEVLHRVRGCEIEGDGCSGWTVGLEPAYTLPNAPQALEVNVLEILPGGPALLVQWIDTNLYETGYDVCESDSPGGSCIVQMLPPDVENLRINSSLQLDSILVTVTARNPAGEAEASTWVQIVSVQDFTIEVVSGDGQSGAVDSGLDDPLVVEVRDGFGTPAEDVDVVFSAQDGGSATPAAAVTDASGQASTAWTLGPSAGSQTLIAELGEASSVFVVFSADASPTTIGAPTAVAASPNDAEGEFDGFTLSWESSDPNAERFRVERRLNGEEGWTTVAEDLGAEERSLFDGASFPTDREVTYRVQACNADATNCSGFGVAATPVYTPPAAPSQVSGEVVAYGQSGFLVRVSWVDGNEFVGGYEVCDAEQPGGECLSENSVGPEERELTFETAASGQFVYVSVAAVNPTGRASRETPVELGLPPGTGAVEGRVVEALSEEAIAGASVQLVPVQSGQQVQTTTDQQGNYRTPPVSPGQYRLVVRRSGYVAVDYFDIDVAADAYASAERVPMAPTSGLTGSISGTARNAQDLSTLPGAQVSLYSGMNARDGQPVATVLTNVSGEFAFPGVSAGTYTLQAEVLGFSVGFRTVVSVGGSEAGEQDIILSPSPLGAGEIRVVLTWGETPADLDAHLTGPSAEDGRFHIYWLEPGDLQTPPFAALDVDDVSSFGPETITISQQSSGVYRYSVHDYTNRLLESSTGLSGSGATVEVYQGDELQGRFFVPQGGGTLWTVFELSNGQVTPVNELSYLEDETAVPSPRRPGAGAPSGKGGPVRVR